MFLVSYLDCFRNEMLTRVYLNKNLSFFIESDFLIKEYSES